MVEFRKFTDLDGLFKTDPYSECLYCRSQHQEYLLVDDAANDAHHLHRLTQLKHGLVYVSVISLFVP